MSSAGHVVSPYTRYPESARNHETVSIDIPQVLERFCYRYPSPLVDAVTEFRPGERAVAVKNVTVNEEFFQGHFPGAPLMPGVLMIEALAQVAALLLLGGRAGSPNAPSGRLGEASLPEATAKVGEAMRRRAHLRGVNRAKFRRQVVPGDQVHLEVTLVRARRSLAKVFGAAHVGSQLVAEAELLLGLQAEPVQIHPAAIVHPNARIGEGTIIGPNAVIGEHVEIGRSCRVGPNAVIEGWTELGDHSEVFHSASIGLIPQDLKFSGEQTRLVIGVNNVFREFVTVHRGTRGGGGVTSIGDHNVFMACAHVAHDCHVGNHTIFGNGATLGGHVLVEDFATISAYSGVHQFCRVGRHAFIGGYSVVTKDALPYGKTVGNRARFYGLNTVGLIRRGFQEDVIARLKRAYRYLMLSKLNASRALAQIEQDGLVECPDVRYLVEFIRDSKRGVILRRPTRRVEEMLVEE
ncbi:MAG: acyl-ACP--UDP-N-acetylglucosamine O-acyltransferase [Luteitalea sp.]|nr:acyl-ACP--UDP-N-acetylglucosamine O-acyltransferase [Luteitalea sp.]